jgi:hypothetical protein
MGAVGSTTVGLGSRIVVFLQVAQEVEDGRRVVATPGQEGDEQDAHLGQGQGG